MKSYFFIPASKLDKVETIRQLEPDEIIIDFEDSVNADSRDGLFEKFAADPQRAEYWIRVFVREEFDDPVSIKWIQQLAALGCKKLIIPKLKSLQELAALQKQVNISDQEIILLVEHPRLLMDFSSQSLDFKLTGLGIGTHDLMNYLGAVHNEKNIAYPRQQLLYLAKALNIKAIDFASMELSDFYQFKKEVVEGLEMGYDAKFILHPRQLSAFNEAMAFPEKTVMWATEVLKHFPDGQEIENTEPIIVDGKIIEKPHIRKARQILQKSKHGT